MSNFRLKCHYIKNHNYEEKVNRDKQLKFITEKKMTIKSQNNEMA